MNQKQFLSWIKNNSQWIISKLENLNDYKNNNKDLEVGDIVMWGDFRNPERFYVSLIDSINIYDKSSKQEWVSYFQQDLYLKGAKNTGSSKGMLVFTLINYEQPYEHLKKDYLFEMLEHQEYVVGNISETIKKPFLNWSQKTPWKKSSSDQ